MHINLNKLQLIMIDKTYYFFQLFDRSVGFRLGFFFLIK
jgi:hypothetical protein